MTSMDRARQPWDKPGHDGKTVTAMHVYPPRIQLQSNTQSPCFTQKRNTSVIAGQATMTNNVPIRS